MSIKILDRDQSDIPIYENFVLVEAKTSEEALQKATDIAKEDDQVDDTITLNDKPARMVFEGIRKLIKVSNPNPMDLDRDRPGEGTEVSYSQYVVSDQEEIDKLVRGDQALILYVE